MAVIHRRQPDIKLDQAQDDLIQVKLLSAVDANPSGEAPPQFLYTKFAQGIFWITCGNEPYKVWLMRAISGPEDGLIWFSDCSRADSVRGSGILA
jgi:hypothetical protein